MECAIDWPLRTVFLDQYEVDTRKVCKSKLQIAKNLKKVQYSQFSTGIPNIHGPCMNHFCAKQ